MTAQPGTRVLKADRDAIAAAARCLAAGGLVAFPTETVYGLGADASQWRDRRPALRGQGAPLVQSVDRTRRGYRRRTGRGSVHARRRKTGGRILAGAADAGAGKAAGLRCRRSRARRSRHVAVRVPAHPVAHALLKAFARPDRRAIGQPLRTCFADERRARARRSARAHRSHHRRRPMRGRRGIDHRVLHSTKPLCCGPAGSRARRSNTYWARRWRRPPPPMKRPLAPGMLTSHYAPKATLRLDADAAAARRSPPRLRSRAILSRHNVQPVATRRPDRSRGQPFLPFARPGRFRSKAHRGNEGAARRPGRGDQ